MYKTLVYTLVNGNMIFCMFVSACSVVTS